MKTASSPKMGVAEQGSDGVVNGQRADRELFTSMLGATPPKCHRDVPRGTRAFIYAGERDGLTASRSSLSLTISLRVVVYPLVRFPVWNVSGVGSCGVGGGHRGRVRRNSQENV